MTVYRYFRMNLDDGLDHLNWEGSTKHIFDKLVDVGELRRSDSRSSGVYFLPHKKVVRAYYKRDDEGLMWAMCSEHGKIVSTPFKPYVQTHYDNHHKNDIVEWDDPPKVVQATYQKTGNHWELICSEHGKVDSVGDHNGKGLGYLKEYNEDKGKGHFNRDHKDDDVQWSYPSKKVSIIYVFINGRYHYGCSEHPTYCKPFSGAGTYDFSYIQARSKDHVRTYHANDDVFFGAEPEISSKKVHITYEVKWRADGKPHYRFMCDGKHYKEAGYSIWTNMETVVRYAQEHVEEEHPQGFTCGPIPFLEPAPHKHDWHYFKNNLDTLLVGCRGCTATFQPDVIDYTGPIPERFL